MKLYYAETLNPRKACAVARHLGSPVEFVQVTLSKGEHKTPDFMTMNPNAKVPVLEAEGRTIWESAAIMCFLARDACSDLWPQDERQVDVVRWLSWDARHFLPYAGTYYFEHIIKPMFGIGPVDQGAIDRVADDFKRSAGVLDHHLRDRAFLVGNSPTIADFAVAITLPYAEEAEIPLDDFPAIRRWHDRMNELEGWRNPFPAMQAAA
ncbi:MAG: glutathione S-transferase family protein [Pararhizobium sp.]